MHELNLIPGEFLQRQRLKLFLQRCTVAYVLLVIVIISAGLYLPWQIRLIDKELDQRQADKQRLLQQQITLDQQVSERSELERRLKILNGLRGGPAARQMFITLDQVLTDQIWFDTWQFTRAGTWTPLDKSMDRSGFLIIARRVPNNPQEHAWRLHTHMEISGQVEDHSTLADFVSRLIRRPDIDDVKVLRTDLRQHGKSFLIDFELAIVVNGDSGTS